MVQVRELTFSVVLFLLALGIQIGGWQSTLVAVVLCVLAVLLALWALRPVIRRLVLRHELSVQIVDENWVEFDSRTYILEVKLRVKNHTDKRKGIDSQIFASTLNSSAGDPDVWRERERRKQTYAGMPSHVEPRSAVEFWSVVSVDRPPIGGHHAYEIGVRDEMGDDYGVIRKARRGRQRVWGSSLWPRA